MDSVDKNGILEPNDTSIRLRKRLVPIEKYIKQMGIDAGMVEQYSRFGVVQVRRCRGRTYVVELPKADEKLPEQKLPGQADRAANVQKITELVRKLTSGWHGNVGEKQVLTKTVPEIPDLHLFDDLYAQAVQTSLPQSRPYIEAPAKLGNRQSLQIVAIFLATFMAAILFVGVVSLIGPSNAGLSEDGRDLEISRLINEYTQASGKVQAMENQLNIADRQLSAMEKEYVSARAALVESYQRNSQALGRIDEVLRYLNDQYTQAE